MKYVDTSVIVAALDHLDHRQARARQFLEREDDKIVSELVLAELASILSRREELLRAIERVVGRLKPELRVLVAVVYILRKFGLRYVGVDGDLLLPPIGRAYTVIVRAIELSGRIKLRTLDLLHLAYVLALREKGYPLKELVTLDEDFIDRKDVIEGALGIRVTTP